MKKVAKQLDKLAKIADKLEVISDELIADIKSALQPLADETTKTSEFNEEQIKKLQLGTALMLINAQLLVLQELRH